MVIFNWPKRAFCLRAVYLMAALCGCSTGHAQPVTLRFDATVHTVNRSPLFDSDIHVAVGDVITGELTFDPSSNNSSSFVHFAVQPYQAMLIIDGHQFQTPDSKRDVRMFSFNNAFIFRDCRGNCVEYDFPVDTLEVTTSLEPVDPLSLPDILLENSSFSLGLYGDTTVLDVARFPANSATWNAFILDRPISVTIRDNGDNVLGFGAIIGTFIAIPEPSTYGIGLVALFFLASARRP